MGQPTYLLIICAVVWGIAVFYFLYAFCGAVHSRLHFGLGADLFSTSWISPNWTIDISDPEWSALRVVAEFYFLAILIQNLFLHCSPTLVHSRLRCLVSLAFLTITFGSVCSALTLSIFGLTWIVSRFRKKCLVYTVNLLLVYLVVYKRGLLRVLNAPLPENDHIVLMFDITVSWSCLRAISLGLAFIDGDVNAMSAFCYYLYLPSLCAGPLINCKDFTRQLNSSTLPSRAEACKLTGITAVRLVAWVSLIELMDHTLFTSATVYDYKNIRHHMSVTEYVGLTFAMMGRFYLKYVIIYGAGEGTAGLEGIWLPERPRCTLRMTSGAQVWRTFDRGLYLWFVEYLYVPLGGGLLASAICFVFACFWHASSSPIQVWAAMNCVLVVIERFCARSLPPTIWIIVQVPLHWLAIGSNMFYLGDHDIGSDFFSHLTSSPLVMASAFLLSLCACVVGRYFEEIDRRLYMPRRSQRARQPAASSTYYK
ncbi:protein-cysteine N-palmitoyltransferase HHAT-like [Tropilaelaps mercedesae]|uniref:Protein-cysteine N-palmitoyltransferase HHAT-like n=1 Tax=Tropilaelaps mercedesae TaxID=418985 RepID=A0A1V9X7C2_9ACAR|nr:protein-cysteine N-palmitoyltransferase HHAT-like [Tropilaelaps mercedesae]